MPPKSKVPEGEMTLAELKRLMKKYDDLMHVDTKGMTREDLIKTIEKMGYTINHEDKSLKLTDKKKAMKRKPINVKMPEKPVKKDKAEKKEKKKLKRSEVIQFILDNPDVLKDAKVSKLHKGVK